MNAQFLIVNGKLQGNLDANGFAILNFDFNSAGLVPNTRTVNGHALSADVVVAFADLGSKPTTVAGYGITDFNALGDARYPQLTGSYTNPSWITSIPFSKLTTTPTTVVGYGITDFNSLGDARWSLLAHTHTFTSLTSKPTTISGYGITDAFTQATADTLYSTLGHTHTFASLTSKPTTIAGYGITDFNSLGDARWSLLAHTHTFASLTSKPTTISGYGITDAFTQATADTLYSALGHTHTFASLTSKPTTLSGFGITDAQPLDGDLTAIAALSGTNNIYYRSAANTWTSVTIGSGLTFSGGTLASSATAYDITTDPLWTTPGDLVVGLGGASATFLPVGSNGFFLKADDVRPAGMRWAQLAVADISDIASTYQPLDAALTALAAGSDFVQFTGPTSSTKVFTLPNASSTLATTTGTETFTNKTLTTPTISTVNSAVGVTLNLAATISAATTAGIAGTAVTISASNAIAGTVTAGAVAGGGVTITAGNAARLTSGNANGGDITFVTGSGIGTGVMGSVLFPDGTTTKPGFAFASSTGTGFYRGASDQFWFIAGSANVFRYLSNSVDLTSSAKLSWCNDTSYSSRDVSLQRSAAGVLEIDTSTAGNWAALKAGNYDTGTTTVTDGLTLAHKSSSGTPAAGYGESILFNLNSSTTADQNAGRLYVKWTDATHSSRTSTYGIQLVSAGGSLADVFSITPTAANFTGSISAVVLTLAAGATSTVAILQTNTGVNNNTRYDINAAAKWYAGVGSSDDRFRFLNSDANGTAERFTIFQDGRIRLSEISTPGAPVNGDIWTDGTHVYCRIGGVSKQLDN